VILLEWGEKFERFRNEADAEIRIERTGENDRKVTFVIR
jgi:tRNA A37 threonylcarbamoyladenosine biosynthesis protein TsaE